MAERGKATIVLGAQYGDEGKGKLVDLMSEHADLVCRVQGGNNAGHTIWVSGRKLVTHLIPSAVLRRECHVALGAGMVIDPFALEEELDTLHAFGADLSPSRLHIDPRAHLILPYHRLQDKSRETRTSGTPIGTTGRGIGPAYASRAYREGPRMADFLDPATFDEALRRHEQLSEGLTTELRDRLASLRDRIAPYVKDVALIANEHLENKKTLLIEGAQGAMLDVSFGSYPFVTSSNLTAGACPGYLGIPAQSIGTVIGVVKAYATRVGNGPFVGELSGQLEEHLRKRGNEFGSTTGRPRRVGWLDLVALRYFARINGITHWSLMKGDVLDGLDSVGLVVGYRDAKTGNHMNAWPMTQSEWDRAEPIVEFCNGWKSVVEVETTLTQDFENFVAQVESFSRVPVAYVSTGPDRNEGCWRHPL